MKTTYTTMRAAILLTLSVSGVSFAGFKDSLGGFGSALGPDSGQEQESQAVQDAGADLNEAVVQRYVAASVSLSQAQAKLADALGLKEEAARIRAANDVLRSGKVSDTEGKDGLEKHHSVSAEVNEKIAEELAKEQELSAQSKQDIALALLPYANGLYQSRQAAQELVPFVASLRPSNPFQLPKVMKRYSTAFFLAKSAPGFVKKHFSTMQQLSQVCKTQGIKIPDEASQVMQGIDI